MELLPLKEPQFIIIGLFEETRAPINPSLFDGVSAGFRAIIYDSPASRFTDSGVLFKIIISVGKSEKLTSVLFSVAITVIKLI